MVVVVVVVEITVALGAMCFTTIQFTKIVSMFGKALSILALLSTSSLSSALGDADNDLSLLSANRRLLHGDEPAWYHRIEEEDTTGLLKKCSRKTVAPADQSRCGPRKKICYFGTQDCDGVGAHPETACYCDGANPGTRTWMCDDESCPAFPDKEKTRCPPNGEEIDHNNDSTCPVDPPGGGVCTAAQEGVTCSYGINKW